MSGAGDNGFMIVYDKVSDAEDAKATWSGTASARGC
jgi:hypothetical protein